MISTYVKKSKNKKTNFSIPNFLVLLTLMFSLVISACSQLSPAPDLLSASRDVNSSVLVSGSNGSVTISNMSNNNLTISYRPEQNTSIDIAKVYITEGDGIGLVTASSNMSFSNGEWTYSYNHPTFTDGAKISFDILTISSGIETNIPQGILGDVTSWASFVYGQSIEGHLVTFDSQDATVEATPSTKVVTEPETTIDSLPAAPSKIGYIFKGWFTQTNGQGEQFNTDTEVTGDITIYAFWEKDDNNGNGLPVTGPNGTIYITEMTNSSLTVSYTPESNLTFAKLFISEGDGMGLVLASQDMNYQSGTYSYTYNHPTFKEGAKIYIDVLQNLNGVESNIPQGVLSNTSSWASFIYGTVITSYEVTFDSQGADIPSTPASITVDSPNTTVGSLPTEPIKNDALFAGWYTDQNGSGSQFTASTVVNSDITVYAFWLVGNTYTVTFDDQDATRPVDPSTFTVLENTTISNMPSDPEKTGYIFMGWNSLEDGTGETFDGSEVITEDITVYAIWQEIHNQDILIDLQPGMHMTMQFNNLTNGEFNDDEIYLTMIAMDNVTKQWCWIKSDGTLEPMKLSDNGALVKNGRQCVNYSLKLSEIDGYQLQNGIAGGRVFVSLGEPIYITVNVDGNGKIGWAAPDLNNETDPNADVYFDWYEFAVVNADWASGSPVGFWGNTTQVDQLCIPLMVRVYDKDNTNQGIIRGYNGISTSRDELWNAWASYVPVEFRDLIGEYRINAPCKDPDGFGHGAPNSSYYDSYVDDIWNQYRTEDLVFDMYWAGEVYEYRGRVQGDAFMFSRPGRDNFIAVARKPNATEILEASGVLATGNTEEGAIQARISAAFNRHVMQDSSLWYTPEAFYQNGPANYYSKFMHEYGYGGKAYGFAYDDVGDFSGAIWSYNGRGVVIDINW